MTDLAQTANRELVLTEGGPTYRIEKRLGLIRRMPRVFCAEHFSPFV